MVSLASAVIGLAFSLGLIRTVLLLAADRIPRADQVRVDWHVLCFAVAVAALCGILFSLAPLWQALRTSPNQVLTSGVRSSASRGSLRLLRTFVVSEIALSFALLTLAAIFLEHTGTLLSVNPGFAANHVTYFELYAPLAKYGNDKTRSQYQKRLLDAIQATAGIEGVGFTSDLPLSGNGYDTTVTPDHRNLSGVSLSGYLKLYDYQLRFINPGFLSTLHIPLVSGHGFGDQIEPDAKVAPVLISQTVARKLWPHQDPIGHILNVGDTPTDLRITGVVRDIKEKLNEPSTGHIYVSYQTAWPPTIAMQWAVRSKLPLETITSQIHRAVASVDSQQSVSAARPLSTLLPASINRETMQSVVVSFFGAAALLLSVLGIYGVVSYSVRQRIPEMGTRLAIGATGNQLVGLVLTDVAKMAA
ncbi:MAG: hypothetical protein M3Y72_27165, partial [Acidobacteriota bacterium]|nr:hypothetical protein [Acidobacteriota bacterium]